MTVSLAGRAPASFEIKSATLPLVALILKSPDLALLARELAARFGDMPDFFDHDGMVVDLAPLQSQADAQIDFETLLPLLRSYRLMPVAVKGGSEAQMAQARAAGLTAANDALVPKQAQASAAAASTAPADPAPPALPSTALVIDKPLRSGQQVYARGRDVVVLAPVNPGAEIIADGSVHVYAPLRGKAIAGARGDTAARILTLCLEPELVSIAGIYRTSEHPLPDSVRSQPAQIRLQGGDTGRLVIDPLNH